MVRVRVREVLLNAGFERSNVAPLGSKEGIAMALRQTRLCVQSSERQINPYECIGVRAVKGLGIAGQGEVGPHSCYPTGTSRSGGPAHPTW